MAEVQSIVEGAYNTSDALCLPIYHWSSNELIGWQTRSHDKPRKIRFRGPNWPARNDESVNMREAAPTLLGERVKPNIAIVTEGPTDAIALSQFSEVADTALIAGCWSSSTIPPQGWWDRNIRISVLSCGDGDKAGASFNRLIADRAGACHVLDVPAGEDVRSLLERDEKHFRWLLTKALMRDPIQRRVVQPRATRGLTARSDLTNIDIVSLVESAGSKRVGPAGDSIKYRCGLHDDVKDPSLTVNPATGSWKCWAGCGQGGVAQFIMAWRRCNYEDAIKFLERRA